MQSEASPKRARRRSGLGAGWIHLALAVIAGCGGDLDQTILSNVPGENGNGSGSGGMAGEPEQLQIGAKYVAFEGGSGSFPLVSAGSAAPIWVSSEDHSGVVRVVGDLRADVERVTGIAPEVIVD